MYDPTDDQLAALRLDASGLQHFAEIVLIGDLEKRFHGCGARSRTDRLGRSAPAEDEVQRVHDNGFSRARFARQDIQAGAELDLDVFDDREILDT